MSQGLQCPHCYQFHLNNMGGSPCTCPCHPEAPEVFGSSISYAEAPTDEGWEKEFDKEFACPHKGVNCTGRCLFSKSNVKSFIASLFQKERGKVSKEAAEFLRETIERQYKQGKSEAFSLVKEIVKKMIHEEKGYWGTERLKIFGWNSALTEFITRLSTLEGK